MKFQNNIRMMIYTSLFTALIIIGSYIAIPTGIIPIVIANMFIFILGLVLPVKWATYSITIYLLLGALGLPVFSGGNGGLHHFYGPTGGYLLGYFLATIAIALISSGKPSWFKDSLALIAGFLLIHLLGISWLIYKFPQGWTNSLPIYWVFVVGDFLKLGLALVIAQKVRKHLNSRLI